MLRADDINYSLISAVREGNLERAKELIDTYGLSYSQGWSRGYVLLRDAVENKRTAFVKLLLASGSRVNSNNMNPTDTPLHLAVRNCDKDIVKMLLDKGAKIDAKDRFGKTVLHEAVGRRAMGVIEILLRYRPDVNSGDDDCKTPLHVAVEMRRLQLVECLLNHGADVNRACASERGKGYTPLHFAVESGSGEVFALLLSRGALVDVKGEDGLTPLHVAAKNGYVSFVESLLNRGACIHSLMLKEGYTPLHIAANRGREKVVKLLLQRGAKVDSRDKDGKTVLRLAVENGNLTIVEDVLKCCPDVNDPSNRSSLKVAAHGSGGECQKIVEALLEYGLVVSPEDANNPKLLHAAIEKGYLEIVEDLLKYGADVNKLHNSTFKEGFTPLHSAAKHKRDEIAKLLISYGADVNAQDKTRKTPIFYAIENSDLKIFDLFITNGANIIDSPELLNKAVEKGCVEIVEALLQRDVDVNARDEYGRTALHYSASDETFCGFRGNNYADINIKGKIAKILLSKGANVDAQTEYGETPLHRSAQKGDEEITVMLLNKGADVNAEEKDGTTPLYFAARDGRQEVVEVLLEHGANVDCKNENDITPLHLAADKGHQEIVEAILKFGASVDSRDKDGRTALHFASRGDHLEVISNLLAYGSDINVTSRNNRTALDETSYSFSRQTYSYDYDDYHNDPPSGICPCEMAAEALKSHIVKMKIANLYLSERNLQSMGWSHEMRDFQCDCGEEIENMKSEKVNINISYYDILAKDTSSLEVYLRNENIVQVLKSEDYKTEFPIYARMIEARFRKGMQRKELLERANKMFPSLFNAFPELPYDCTEKIFCYLSEEDLKNFNRCLQAS